MPEEKAPDCTCGGFRLWVQPDRGSVTIRAERQDAGASDAPPCIVVCQRETPSGDTTGASPRQIVIRCGPESRDPDRPPEPGKPTCC